MSVLSLAVTFKTWYSQNMEAFEILIIILSVTLTVFLIVLTYLLVQLIKISRIVKSVADKAEDVAENVADASRYIKPAVVSAKATKFINKILGRQAKKGG